MIEARCSNCGHLLFKESVRDGEIEIKCPKCKQYTRIERVTLREKDAFSLDNDN